MRPACFIINPKSHNVNKKGSVLKKAFSDNKGSFLYISDFSDIGQMVKSILADNTKHVFIEAGDGTIQSVLSEFVLYARDTLPDFTLLAGGNTNLVARHVGIKKPDKKTVLQILANPYGREKRELPMLGIKAENHIIYGFLLSSGAMPNATKYCNEQIHTKGIDGARAVIATLWKILSDRKDSELILKPTKLVLEYNNNKYEDLHIFCIASTLPSLMLGLNPFWDNGGGAINLSFGKKNARNYFLNIMRVLGKKTSETKIKKLQDDGFFSLSANEIKMVTDSDIVLDGEFLQLANKKISLFASTPIRFIR